MAHFCAHPDHIILLDRLADAARNPDTARDLAALLDADDVLLRRVRRLLHGGTQ